MRKSLILAFFIIFSQIQIFSQVKVLFHEGSPFEGKAIVGEYGVFTIVSGNLDLSEKIKEIEGIRKENNFPKEVEVFILPTPMNAGKFLKINLSSISAGKFSGAKLIKEYEIKLDKLTPDKKEYELIRLNGSNVVDEGLNPLSDVLIYTEFLKEPYKTNYEGLINLDVYAKKISREVNLYFYKKWYKLEKYSLSNPKEIYKEGKFKIPYEKIVLKESNKKVHFLKLTNYSKTIEDKDSLIFESYLYSNNSYFYAITINKEKNVGYKLKLNNLQEIYSEKEVDKYFGLSLESLVELKNVPKNLPRVKVDLSKIKYQKRKVSVKDKQGADKGSYDPFIVIPGLIFTGLIVLVGFWVLFSKGIEKTKKSIKESKQKDYNKKLNDLIHIFNKLSLKENNVKEYFSLDDVINKEKESPLGVILKESKIKIDELLKNSKDIFKEKEKLEKSNDSLINLISEEKNRLKEFYETGQYDLAAASMNNVKEMKELKDKTKESIELLNENLDEKSKNLLKLFEIIQDTRSRIIQSKFNLKTKEELEKIQLNLKETLNQIKSKEESLHNLDLGELKVELESRQDARNVGLKVEDIQEIKRFLENEEN